MTLKKKILDLLGDQYKPSDEPLIDELIYNFKLLQQAKDSIDADGILLDVVRDPKKDPFYQKNPAIGVYDTCLKNINQLYTKLNVSPLDRRSWVVSDEEDDFDSEF